METKQIYLVECKREENEQFNDNVNLLEKLSEFFEENPNEIAEIIVLDDDYIDYIKSNNFKDNVINRRQYVTFNPKKQYEQMYINSGYSELVDTAIIPIAISNEENRNKIIEIRLTDDRRKKLSDYFSTLFNGSTANSVFGGLNTKNIAVDDYVLSYDERIFENENDLISEVLDFEDYKITRTYKKLKLETNVIFFVGFIYVVAVTKIPHILNVSKFNEIISCERITDVPIDVEKINEIIQNEDYKLSAFTNYLINPEDFEDVVDEWAEQTAAVMNQELDNFSRLEEITKNHKKNKKV